MKANKINIDDFINDTITELQKYDDKTKFSNLLSLYKEICVLSDNKKKERIIKRLLTDKYPFYSVSYFASIIKYSAEYLAKYKAFFNSNHLYINEVATKFRKGQKIKIFLFNGGSYNLENVSNDICFKLYNTTKLTVKNKTNFKINIYAYDNAEVNAFGCNVSVHACNNANIYAFGGCYVYAENNATVHAYDNVNTYAFHNCKIFAYNNTSVSAYDCAKILAFNNSIIYGKQECNGVIKTFHNVKIYSFNNYGTIILRNNTSVINTSKNTNIIAHDNANIISVENENVQTYDNANKYIYDLIKEIYSHDEITNIEYKNITILKNWHISPDGCDFSFFLCKNKIPNYCAMDLDYRTHFNKNIKELNYKAI